MMRSIKDLMILFNGICISPEYLIKFFKYAIMSFKSEMKHLKYS